jgi:hypothetical protein
VDLGQHSGELSYQLLLGGLGRGLSFYVVDDQAGHREDLAARIEVARCWRGQSGGLQHL